MIDSISPFFQSKDKPRTKIPELRPKVLGGSGVDNGQERRGFTKVFRWPVPADQKPQPKLVEVVGSFSGWRKLPLTYDPPSKTWQVTVDHIEGNRTHRYAMLVDGNPTYDKTCDGLTAPQTAEETRWQIATPRGPRTMLLFSQTK